MRNPLTRSEIWRLEKYLRNLFRLDTITIVERPKQPDSVEVQIDGEFVGVLFKDEEDGEISYAFNMAILEMDLPEAPASRGYAASRSAASQSHLLRNARISDIHAARQFAPARQIGALEAVGQADRPRPAAGRWPGSWGWAGPPPAARTETAAALPSSRRQTDRRAHSRNFRRKPYWVRPNGPGAPFGIGDIGLVDARQPGGGIQRIGVAAQDQPHHRGIRRIAGERPAPRRRNSRARTETARPG